MLTSSLSSTAPAAFSVRKLLPREHGSWALAVEPIALGLIAAFSPAGAWLALSVTAAFLARRPWQLCQDRSDARAALLILGAVGVFSLLVSVKIAGAEILLPLLAALPAGLIFLWHDTQSSAREAVAEIAGAATFAFVPAALALCAGLPAERAWILAALMLMRAVPAVGVVRNYLRTRKGRGSGLGRGLALGGSFAAAALTGALVANDRCPPIGFALAGVLALRAAWLLGPWAPSLSAKKVGVLESVLGAVYVAALGALY